jgi:hypothetical protein
MTRFRWLLAGLLLLAGTAPAAAQESRPLWKAFDTLDRPFWEESRTETSQVMKVQGMDVSQKQSQTFYLKWTPRKKTDNRWEVDYEIVGLKLDIEIGGNKISYDSQADTAPGGPMVDFFAALVNSKLRLTIENDPKDGIKVTGVDGADALIEKLAGANATGAAMKPMLESMFSKDNINSQLAVNTGVFSANDEEFKKGSWTRSTTMDMGAIGRYDTVYTYVAKAGEPGKYVVEGRMKYTAPRRGEGLPFKIKGARLSSDKITGTVTIDPRAGRVQESQTEMKLHGKLTIEVGGMDTEVELVEEQTVTSRTLTSDPIRKKE